MLGYINYKNNCRLEASLPKGLLNAQGLGTLQQYRYGLFSFGWCGCEIIAVYNFLQMIGRPRPLCDISREIYRYGHLLLGFFGTNVYVIPYYFRRHHIPTETTRNKTVFLREAAKGKCGVISFWTGKVLRSSIHTVAFRMEEGGTVRVFNRYNKKDFDHVYNSLPEAFGAYPFLTANWV
ncbi:MAG: hypothetical protein IJU96_06855 [Clostridia bacterium]|nr:hypothetical protein [Clostridia bacterium]